MHKFKAILFDLDGTLVDTASDLAAALNHVLISENKSPLSLEKIRHVASDGAKGLLNLGFGFENEILRKRLVDYYGDHIADNSRLFDGMEDLLQLIEHKKIPWGIVTNKPTILTEKLLKKLNLDKRTSCVVCGDTLEKRKPHPEPLLHAATLLKVKPEECCYIGDGERDIISAKAAKMFSIAALYGYIHEGEDPKTWHADDYARAPGDLRSMI